MNRNSVLKKILEHKVMAIVRLNRSDLVQPTAKALFDGGIKILEITLNTPDALTHISDIHTSLQDEQLVGAGTVLNETQCEAAIKAGASFIVTPILHKGIIACAHKYEAPVFMGAMTPTEIWESYQAGADVIKLFPAKVLGLEYFKAVKAPLSQVPMMPTGGVTRENARTWIEAGAIALGVGGALTDKQIIADENFSQIRENAEAFCRSL